MYYNGHGVLADFVIAPTWYIIGAANGNEMGAENIELIAEDMTWEDISKAEAMARVCMNSTFEKCGYLPMRTIIIASLIPVATRVEA